MWSMAISEAFQMHNHLNFTSRNTEDHKMQLHQLKINLMRTNLMQLTCIKKFSNLFKELARSYHVLKFNNYSNNRAKLF